MVLEFTIDSDELALQQETYPYSDTLEIDVDFSDGIDIEFSTILDEPVDYIQFNRSYTGTNVEGRIQLDSTEITPVVGIAGGFSLPLLKAIFKRVQNKEADTLTVGTFVYVTGSTGDYAQVKRANASSISTSYVLGAVYGSSIDKNQFGIVVEFGYCKGINTYGMAYGAPVWLNTSDGGYTVTRPTAPNISVFLGYIIRAHATEGIIAIRPTVIPRIMTLSDVLGSTSPSELYDALLWNPTNSRFEISNKVGDLAERVGLLEENYIIHYVTEEDCSVIEFSLDKHGTPLNFQNGDIIELLVNVKDWVNNGRDVNRPLVRLNNIDETVYIVSGGKYGYIPAAPGNYYALSVFVSLPIVDSEIVGGFYTALFNGSETPTYGYGTTTSSIRTEGLQQGTISSITLSLLLPTSFYPAGTEFVIKKR